MEAIVWLAEERIRAAIERGEFRDLPGAGKPLSLDDDSMVPAELRAAYRILKNAGCLPPELEARKELVTLKSLLSSVEEDGERRRLLRELDVKLLRVNVFRKRPILIEDLPEYGEKIRKKLAR